MKVLWTFRNTSRLKTQRFVESINCWIGALTWFWYARGGYGAVPLVLHVSAEAVAAHHELLQVKVFLGDEPVHGGAGPVLVRASRVAAQDDVPDLVVAENVAKLRCQVSVTLKSIQH